jgi:hypothetical protein
MAKREGSPKKKEFNLTGFSDWTNNQVFTVLENFVSYIKEEVRANNANIRGIVQEKREETLEVVRKVLNSEDQTEAKIEEAMPEVEEYLRQKLGELDLQTPKEKKEKSEKAQAELDDILKKHTSFYGNSFLDLLFEVDSNRMYTKKSNFSHELPKQIEIILNELKNSDLVGLVVDRENRGGKVPGLIGEVSLNGKKFSANSRSEYIRFTKALTEKVEKDLTENVEQENAKERERLEKDLIEKAKRDVYEEVTKHGLKSAFIGSSFVKNEQMQEVARASLLKSISTKLKSAGVPDRILDETASEVFKKVLVDYKKIKEQMDSVPKTPAFPQGEIGGEEVSVYTHDMNSENERGNGSRNGRRNLRPETRVIDREKGGRKKYGSELKVLGQSEDKSSKEVDYPRAIGKALDKSLEKDKRYIDEEIASGNFEKVENLFNDEESLRAGFNHDLQTELGLLENDTEFEKVKSQNQELLDFQFGIIRDELKKYLEGRRNVSEKRNNQSVFEAASRGVVEEKAKGKTGDRKVLIPEDFILPVATSSIGVESKKKKENKNSEAEMFTFTGASEDASGVLQRVLNFSREALEDARKKVSEGSHPVPFMSSALLLDQYFGAKIKFGSQDRDDQSRLVLGSKEARAWLEKIYKNYRREFEQVVSGRNSQDEEDEQSPSPVPIETENLGKDQQKIRGYTEQFIAESKERAAKYDLANLLRYKGVLEDDYKTNPEKFIDAIVEIVNEKGVRKFLKKKENADFVLEEYHRAKKELLNFVNQRIRELGGDQDVIEGSEAVDKMEDPYEYAEDNILSSYANASPEFGEVDKLEDEILQANKLVNDLKKEVGFWSFITNREGRKKLKEAKQRLEDLRVRRRELGRATTQSNVLGSRAEAKPARVAVPAVPPASTGPDSGDEDLDSGIVFTFEDADKLARLGFKLNKINKEISELEPKLALIKRSNPVSYSLAKTKLDRLRDKKDSLERKIQALREKAAAHKQDEEYRQFVKEGKVGIKGKTVERYARLFGGVKEVLDENKKARIENSKAKLEMLKQRLEKSRELPGIKYRFKDMINTLRHAWTAKRLEFTEKTLIEKVKTIGVMGILAGIGAVSSGTALPYFSALPTVLGVSLSKVASGAVGGAMAGTVGRAVGEWRSISTPKEYVKKVLAGAGLGALFGGIGGGLASLFGFGVKPLDLGPSGKTIGLLNNGGLADATGGGQGGVAPIPPKTIPMPMGPVDGISPDLLRVPDSSSSTPTPPGGGAGPVVGEPRPIPRVPEIPFEPPVVGAPRPFWPEFVISGDSSVAVWEDLMKEDGVFKNVLQSLNMPATVQLNTNQLEFLAEYIDDSLRNAANSGVLDSREILSLKELLGSSRGRSLDAVFRSIQGGDVLAPDKVKELVKLITNNIDLERGIRLALNK